MTLSLTGLSNLYRQNWPIWTHLFQVLLKLKAEQQIVWYYSLRTLRVLNEHHKSFIQLCVQLQRGRFVFVYKSIKIHWVEGFSDLKKNQLNSSLFE